MSIRQQVLSLVMAMMVGGPGAALAQGRGHRMGAGGGQGHQSNTLQALEPQIQQVGALMHQMAERIKAGPLTSDQALHLSGMLEQMATIMTKMAAGIPGADVAEQLARMQEHLTAMQPQATRKVGPAANTEIGPSAQKP